MIEVAEGGLKDVGVIHKASNVYGSVFFFPQDEVLRVCFDLMQIYSIKIFGSDAWILLGFSQVVTKILSVIEVFLHEVLVVEKMRLLFGLEVLLLFEMILKSAVI